MAIGEPRNKNNSIIIKIDGNLLQTVISSFSKHGFEMLTFDAHAPAAKRYAHILLTVLLTFSGGKVQGSEDKQSGAAAWRKFGGVPCTLP